MAHMTLAIVYGVAILIILLLGVMGTVVSLRKPHRFTFTDAVATGTPTTPQEANLKGHDVTLSLSDGAATPGFIVEGHNPDGPCLFSLHGFGSSRYRSFVWLQPFLPHVSKMVFYDQRGQGESDAPTCHNSTTEADDLLDIIRQVPAQHLNHGIAFYGRSMGAATVISAGAKFPHHPISKQTRLRAVIAEAPYARWHEPVYHVFRRRGYPTWPFIAMAGWVFRLINPPLAKFDRHDDAAKLACPLLVIHGDADDTCDYQTGQSIAEAADEGTFVRIPGGRHYGLAEHDPDRYREALTTLFESLETKDAP